MFYSFIYKATTRKTTTTTTKSKEEQQSTDLIESMCGMDDYGYMPHPKDCRQYIYCQDGIAKVFNCQGGLLWKQSDANCVWPLDSDCPTLKKTTPFSNQLVGGGSGSNLPAGGGFNNFPTNNNNNFNNINNPQAIALLKENYGTIECPMDATGFFPNPFDCSAYHFCSVGKDQVILCEPGLHYRPDKQVCDWPANTNCK